MQQKRTWRTNRLSNGAIIFARAQQGRVSDISNVPRREFYLKADVTQPTIVVYGPSQAHKTRREELGYRMPNRRISSFPPIIATSICILRVSEIFEATFEKGRLSLFGSLHINICTMARIGYCGIVEGRIDRNSKMHLSEQIHIIQLRAHFRRRL